MVGELEIGPCCTTDGAGADSSFGFHGDLGHG